MKTILIKSIIIVSLIFAFTACNKDETDTRLAPVKTLIEPTNERAITLQASASAAIYFEWEPVSVNEGGMVLYQIAFDKIDGDFSNPAYIVFSDNSGGKNNVSISHKQINKIAKKLGIGSAQTGTFKWAVFTSKGINAMKSEQENRISITRLAGFEEEEFPIDVFVTGEASEGGADLSKAQQMKATANGEFEVYTKLTEGKTYYFTDAKTGTTRQFYVDDNLLKEGTTTITAPKTAVYRINLDFSLGIAAYTEVTAFKLYFCPAGDDIFELPYIGNGIFKASSQPVTFHEESWGRDERYKFRMHVIDNGAATIEYWGTKNGTDSRPDANSPESYYHMMNTPANQWDQKWKFAGEMDYALVDVTAYFQAAGEYTHEVKKVGNH